MSRETLFALAACLVMAAGCDRPTTATVPLDDWCFELERALHDREETCGCGGAPLDDAALRALCADRAGSSLAAAEDAGEVLWNGALASANLGAVDDADCAHAELLDDPVVGEVPIGGACRVFTDVAGLPDDCVRSAACVVPAEGGDARCVARDALCTSASGCPGGDCVSGACVTPVCTAAP
jgi:hypothetical protein